jgi:hypothetical protein
MKKLKYSLILVLCAVYLSACDLGKKAVKRSGSSEPASPEILPNRIPFKLSNVKVSEAIYAC